jgi:hypothetical protein
VTEEHELPLRSRASFLSNVGEFLFEPVFPDNERSESVREVALRYFNELREKWHEPIMRKADINCIDVRIVCFCGEHHKVMRRLQRHLEVANKPMDFRRLGEVHLSHDKNGH